jgi:hypothetical protein
VAVCIEQAVEVVLAFTKKPLLHCMHPVAFTPFLQDHELSVALCSSVAGLPTKFALHV